MEIVTHMSSLPVLLRTILCDLDLALSARCPNPPLPANGKVYTILPFSGADPLPRTDKNNIVITGSSDAHQDVGIAEGHVG